MRIHEIEEVYSVYRDPLYQQYKTAIDFAINKYVTTGSAIYKGSARYARYGEEGLIIRDPMSFPEARTSKNTMNYYTEWVDHSASWSHFPKRSRSLICSTSKNYAEDYGAVRVVVPVQNTAVGVCPERDWWFSFDRTSRRNGPDAINTFVHEVLKENGIFLNGRTVKYEEFAPHFNAIDVSKANMPYYYDDLKDIAVAKGGLGGLMDYVFDPVANEFRLITWKDFNITGNHEVWLNAPCVMVPLNVWNNLVNS